MTHILKGLELEDDERTKMRHSRIEKKIEQLKLAHDNALKVKLPAIESEMVKEHQKLRSLYEVIGEDPAKGLGTDPGDTVSRYVASENLSKEANDGQQSRGKRYGRG